MDLITGLPTMAIRRRLEVLGNRTIQVPGCEPTSAVTSLTLHREQHAVCKNTTVDLQAALNAIPGSHIEYGFNNGGRRLTWFVFPDVPYGCCASGDDWYKTLRNLPPAPDIIEDKFNYCETYGMGFCPSGDFKMGIPETPANPGDGAAMPPSYLPEKTDILNRFYNPLNQPKTGVTVDLPI